MSDNDTGVDAGTNTQEYPYSVKITQTAYGARVSIHAYSTSLEDVLTNATFLYAESRRILIENGYKIAPEEDPKPKNSSK